ncbi:hypothetical protein H1V43_18375 [Streptomyces sp. PSKA54]|uniref:Uncharacterized protein n=1 Tax=Streptomyces himalayensis subsp. aureolus TaxID=2758039 RepID=A0A7W2D203_9ACTN|nr:hypothetical protein [Streptomyces himalayensis]MBA4863314.1 hypothetical protein [Streptomyces himalayensis subsp. aureolus]
MLGVPPPRPAARAQGGGDVNREAEQLGDRLVRGEPPQEFPALRQVRCQRGGVAHQGDGRAVCGLLAHGSQFVAGLLGALLVPCARDGRLVGRLRAAHRSQQTGEIACDRSATSAPPAATTA